MKKIFSLSTGLVLYACMIINAQVLSRDLHQAGKFTVYKKSDSGNNSRFSARVAPEVVRNFIEKFGEVPNEKWFDVGSGFIAMFRLSNMDYQVAYDKKGNWLRTIRSYTEDELPRDVRHLVKSNYYDYSINLVQEIQTINNPTTYIMQLVGKTELLSISVSDGDFQLLKRFTKSQ